MVLLKILLPYQWRSFWRGLRARGAWGGTNLTLVLLLAMWLLPGHLTSSIVAALCMRDDPTGAGALLAEINLAALLVTWLVTPVVITGLQVHGEGVTPSRLTSFPLRPRQLMLAGVSGCLVHPGYWLLGLASIAGLAPIAMAPLALPGLVAGVLFFASAALLSWGLGLFGSVLFSSRRAREFVLLLIAGLATSLVFAADVRLDHRASGFFATAWGREWLLSDTAGTRGLLPALRDNTPGAWVVRIALGRAIVPSFALLLAWFTASWFLAVWCLRRMVRHPVTGLGGGRAALATVRAIPLVPRAIGVIAGKETRHLFRTMDAILGIALGLGGAIYLAVAANPSRLVLLFGIPMILIMEMSMPMNSFGLDRAAVDRYRLFPLTGREVIMSKNTAFFLVVLAQVTPLVAAAAFRFGPLIAGAALLGTGSFALLLTLWGNVTSVRSPAPRAFYNFDSVEQVGGVASVLYSLFVWLAPGLMAVLTGTKGPLWIFAGQILFFAACVGLYARTIPARGASFDVAAERMRSRLAG